METFLSIIDSKQLGPDEPVQENEIHPITGSERSNVTEDMCQRPNSVSSLLETRLDKRNRRRIRLYSPIGSNRLRDVSDFVTKQYFVQVEQDATETNDSENTGVDKQYALPSSTDRAYSPILLREDYLLQNTARLYSNKQDHSNRTSASSRLERNNCSFHTECFDSCEPGRLYSKSFLSEIQRGPRRLRKRSWGNRSKSLIPDRQFSLPPSPLLGIDHQKPNVFNHYSLCPKITDSGFNHKEVDSKNPLFLPHQQLSNCYCRSCKTIRLHFKDVCSKCKQPLDCSSEHSSPSVPESTGISIIKTDFLQTAALGLSEFSPSSSEEDKCLNGGLSSKQRPDTADQEVNFKVALSPNAYETKPASLKTSHTSAMDSPEELMQRIARLEEHVDSLYSLSNSSSHSRDSGKQNGLTAYARPKLPAVLVKEQANASQPGCVIPVCAPDASNHIYTNGFQETKPAHLRTNSQQLIAQLELRSKGINGCAQASTDAHSLLHSQSSNEDREVAQALSGADKTKNINHRLLTMLKRRNGTRTTAVAGTNDLENKTSSRVPRLNNAAAIPTRTRSLQPTCRMQNRVGSERRDPSNVSTRAGSETINSESSSDSRKLHTCAKAAPISGQKVKGNAMNTTKTSALLSWQRRKAYDPQSSLMNVNSVPKDNPRVAMNTGRTNITQRQPAQLLRTTGTGRRSSRRFSNGFNLTAPVQTADCLAALQSIKVQNEYPSHCSVVPRLLLDPVNGNKLRSPTPTNHLSVNAPHSIASVEGRRKRLPRSSSVNAADMPGTTNGRGARTHRDNEQARARFNGKPQTNAFSDHKLPRSVSARQPMYTRPGSRTECQEFGRGGETKKRNPQVVNKMNKNWLEIDSEKPYPDVAVESIRFKSERLADFIVRLRRKVEQDYAEQGTCSPGDDVFGDEAIGAVVDGQPTGMHPVVTACLRNLRILEFNAQEIFSLLYPTEIDLWEPTRTSSRGNADGEQTYSDAQGKMTDQDSQCIKQCRGRTSPKNSTKGRLPPPGLAAVNMSRERTAPNPITPTEDGDVI